MTTYENTLEDSHSIGAITGITLMLIGLLVLSAHATWTNSWPVDIGANIEVVNAYVIFAFISYVVVTAYHYISNRSK